MSALSEMSKCLDQKGDIYHCRCHFGNVILVLSADNATLVTLMGSVQMV